MTIASDSPTGYIFEVDLEYSQNLHDMHTDLSFRPTRDKPLGKREKKLLATLYNKQRYVIHYRNPQQCTRHGLRVKKKDSSHVTNHTISMASRLYPIKYRFQNSREQ